MSNNKIMVTRSSIPSFEEYCHEIAPLWDTHWLTNRGIKHEQLENELRRYLSVENISLFVNGHSALECILEAMDLGYDGRDEVITTPFTFASTTHAIVRKGLKPVFCDIKPDNYTIDPAKIEALITDRTCAIIPVHVYGNLCDIDEIQTIANFYGLKVIYDAAHAFGVEKNGIGVGNFGDASMFSFHATKVFNTVEGGAICCSDDQLCNKLSQWCNFGITGPETVEYVGGNAKMNEFCAAMGLCNLRHVDEEIEKRHAVYDHYLEKLEGVEGITLSKPKEDIRPNYAYFPIFIDKEAFGATRDDVFATLTMHNIGARKYFYPLVSNLDCYVKRGLNKTPIANYVSENVLAMPLYADLSPNNVSMICDVMLNYNNRKKL